MKNPHGLGCFLLHSDRLPQQHILMHGASVLTKTAAIVSKISLNHVEPFLFATHFFTDAGSDLAQTAPASASAMSSNNAGASNCSTCRKKERKRSKSLKELHLESQCFIMFQYMQCKTLTFQDDHAHSINTYHLFSGNWEKRV